MGGADALVCANLPGLSERARRDLAANFNVRSTLELCSDAFAVPACGIALETALMLIGVSVGFGRRGPSNTVMTISACWPAPCAVMLNAPGTSALNSPSGDIKPALP